MRHLSLEPPEWDDARTSCSLSDDGELSIAHRGDSVHMSAEQVSTMMRWLVGEGVRYELTRDEAHRRCMAKLKAMTPEQVFQTSVRAGIHNPDGTLTEKYRSDPDQEDPQ